MNCNLIKNIALSIASAAVIMSASSCVKETFSAPVAPANTDPAGIYPTMTIKDFKTQYIFHRAHVLDSASPVLITDSIILSGVVNSDDRSGNLYKQLIFQDSTGGLQIVVDAADLYNTFPVGTKIFVKCKGLYLYNYLGTLEIGSYINRTGAQPSLGGIPWVNLSTYVLRGMKMDTVLPKRLTLAQINGADPINDQSILVQVDSVHFAVATNDTTTTYADAINKAFGNVNLNDCPSPPNSVTVRTSGYANFATTLVPHGYGSVLGIFSIYNKSSGPVNQLTIRDLNDVRLTRTRADICH